MEASQRGTGSSLGTGSLPGATDGRRARQSPNRIRTTLIIDVIACGNVWHCVTCCVMFCVVCNELFVVPYIIILNVCHIYLILLLHKCIYYCIYI